MTPTEENLREVAEFRLRKRPWMIEPAVRHADHYATRSHHPAETAQQAVGWALGALVEEGSTGDVARRTYVDGGGCPAVAPADLSFAWCNDHAGHDGKHWCMQHGGYVVGPEGEYVRGADGHVERQMERVEW